MNRSLFAWYGGKAVLAKKIVPYIPRARVYVEPYCGAASIFWNIDPMPIEVLNDLNEEIVGLYRVLQDTQQFKELKHKLKWTPYSRAEFRKAIATKTEDTVEKAWAFFVKMNQGFSGKANKESDWSKDKLKRCKSKTWCQKVDALHRFRERLSNVQIDCGDAVEVVKCWDSFDTVFYLDPPYVHRTRTFRKDYAYECDDKHHERLVSRLLQLKGKAVLSGYENEIYKPLEDAGWKRVDFQVVCNATNSIREQRTETLWIKDKTSKKKYIGQLKSILKRL